MNTVYNKIYSDLDEHYVPPQPPPSFKDVMERINILEQKLNQLLKNGS